MLMPSKDTISFTSFINNIPHKAHDAVATPSSINDTTSVSLRQM